MAFLKFTTDKAVKRGRWLMVATILLDKLCTVVGQPHSYWQHPNTADEVNRGWHYALSHGWQFYLTASFFVILALFLVVSAIPRKIALVVIFSSILNHYFGASHWLCYHWNLGVGGPLIYGVILSVILVLFVFPPFVSQHTET